MAVVVLLVMMVLVVAVVLLVKAVDTHPEDPVRYFARHRAQMHEVAALVQNGSLRAPPDDAYYGPQLPEHLRHLSVTGRVSLRGGNRFFLPRWTGIPDDAGGYWHSEVSPEYEDMYGMGCVDPLLLAEEWWSCGMTLRRS